MMEFLSFGEPLVGFYPPKGASVGDDVPITKTWGGDTSNFAIGVARLGHSVSYLARVGADPFGEGFIALWRRNGVDTSLIARDEARRTGLYFVSFDAEGKHSLTYYRRDSAASAIAPEMIGDRLLSKYRALHLSGISLGMSPSAFAAGLALEEAARRTGCVISFDVNYRAAQWPSPAAASEAIGTAIADGVDVLEVTDDEMAALGWGEGVDALARRFPKAAAIILKRGKRGASLWRAGERADIPSFEVAVKDTVGAGDSFDAGFLSATLRGASLREAGRFAAATAALTCTGTGPLERMPFLNEVEAFLAARATASR
jgi:2-dehydro-3-deoxygluconokinase